MTTRRLTYIIIATSLILFGLFSQADSGLSETGNNIIFKHDIAPPSTSDNSEEVQPVLPVDKWTTGISSKSSRLPNYSISKTCIANRDNVLSLNSMVTLNIPANAMSCDEVVKVEVISSNDLPAIPTDLVNVTKGKAAYRFSPHGLHFLTPVSLEIRFDESLIPPGYSIDDINTYFYDDKRDEWTPVKRIGHNEKEEIIISQTTHFSDYINAIIKIPDTSEPYGHSPTTFRDFQANNPGEAVTLMPTPKPNPMGQLDLSYIINLTEGRGLTPQVAITCTNDPNSRTWLGNSWDYSPSKITVDTKWGAPRYDSNMETEPYSLDESSLAPVTYRSEWEERVPDRRFNPRILKNFEVVIRHGDTPNNYWWEVIQKDGIVHYYGGTKDGLSENGVLRIDDEDSPIASWYLVETRDINDNFILYEYEEEIHTSVAGGNPGKHKVVRNIYYTGHGNNRGKYRVQFLTNRDLGESDPKQVRVDCRKGYKEVIVVLLREVNLYFGEELVRKYELKYQEKPLEKIQLTSITEIDGEGEAFEPHLIEYFDEISTGNSPQGRQFNFLEAETAAEIPADPIVVPISGPNGMNGRVTPLSTSRSNGRNTSVSVTFGANDWNLWSKSRTLGGNVGFGSGSGVGVVALLDIDGDLLPDKLFIYDDGSGYKTYYRPNLGYTEDQGLRFSTTAFPVEGLDVFSYTRIRNSSKGFEAHPPGATISYTKSKSTSITEVYFADINTDGIIDVVKNGIVRFGYVDEGGLVKFSILPSLTPCPLLPGAPLDTEIVDFDPAEQEALENEYPLHDVVRVWEAPFNGRVSITAPVSLEYDNSIEAMAYSKKDGVIVQIQKDNENPLWSQLIDTTSAGIAFNPSGVSDIPVNQGDHVYFRVQSICDGAFDQVNWNPVIQYINFTNEEIQNDPNGKNLYRYEASSDFLAASPQSVSLPFDGDITIQSSFAKPPTTDSVYVEIIRRFEEEESTVYRDTFSPLDIVNENLTFNINGVVETEELYFKVYSSTNIDWQSIEWVPFLFYTEAGSLDVYDENMEPIYTYYPSVEMSIYSKMIRRGNARLMVQDTMDYSINAYTSVNQSFSEAGTMTISIKGRSKLYSKRTVFIDADFTGGGFSGTTLLPEDEVTVECFFSSTALAQEARSKLYFVTSDGGNAPDYYAVRENFEFGPQFRGWGQFAYNANDGRAELPIDESLLVIDSELMDNNLNIDAISDTAHLEGQFDPTTSILILMHLDPFTNTWKGYDDLTYVTPVSMSASRLGEDDIKLDYGLNGSVFSTIPHKISESTSHSASIGVSASIINGTENYSWITSTTVLDGLDFNGDGKQDAASGNKIQYSLPTGGLESSCVVHDLGLHSARGFGVNVGIGAQGASASLANSGSQQKGAAPTPAYRSAGEAAVAQLGADANLEQKVKTAYAAGLISGSSISLSGNLTISNKDNIKSTWLDINGDGLPDKVYENGLVALNLGHSFLPLEQWEINRIREGTTSNHGGGIGLSIAGGSISGGVSFSRTENHSVFSIQDVTSDGIPDLLTLDSLNRLWVQIGTGSGYSEQRYLWNEGEKLDEGTSTGQSINAAFTVCIPLIPFPAPVTKLCINPSTSSNTSVSRQNTQISDIDGDGNVDFLMSDHDGDLRYKRSLIGKTGLIKQVNRPMGSFLAFDYTKKGNSYKMPQSSWVLSEITEFDGFSGDGEDYNNHIFQYENGNYDRCERAFLGFETVIDHELASTNEDDIYRTITSTYDNTTYHRKGLLLKSTLSDAENNIYTQMVNNYTLFNLNGDPLPNDFDTAADGIAFPALVQTINTSFEGGQQALQQQIDYTYDAIGNIINYRDSGDGSDEDWKEAVITFHDHPVVKDAHESIKVLTSTGKMRYRKTEIDETGNVTQIRQYLSDNVSANTDMHYDQYGNLDSIQRPPNSEGDRLTYSYIYDDEVHSYPISVSDSYGYTSKSEYDYRFGKPILTVDINGEETKYVLDAKGRVEKVTGPYELAAGLDYTIAMEYFPNANIPYAITKHYDPENGEDVKTITFTDGLNSVLQVKKTGLIFNPDTNSETPAMVISGRIKFDAQRREIERRHPTHDTSEMDDVFFSEEDPIVPTRKQYDILDRVTQMVLPDDAIISTTYTIAEDYNGRLRFNKTTTDPLGNSKEIFTDIRYKQVVKVDYTEGRAILTQFEVNPIGEVLRVRNQHGEETVFTYDLLGRTTAINHHVSGLTESNYDLAGNLLTKITSDLRETIPQGGAIQYQYEYERLVKIDYPRNYLNQVIYHYGAPNDTLGRAGRLLLQEDATGAIEYLYGPLGERTKEIRTITLNPSTQRTFVTEYEYDTWNRLQRMIYPDGEIVTYHYNTAGKLIRMMGVKEGRQYPIIKHIGYDKFEHRIYMQYGNDVETTYSYEPDRRRLEQILVNFGEVDIMDNNYSYDLAENIDTIMNIVPPTPGRLGGMTMHTYEYDDLYRVKAAKGSYHGYLQSAEYELAMAYNDIHNIVKKKQTHTLNGAEPLASNYEYDYKYVDSIPHFPVEIGNREITKDANGNMTSWRIDSTGESRLLFWDEENRLVAVYENGVLSQYVYDAQGNRVIKYTGEIQGVFQNGQPLAFTSGLENFTLYVNEYLVLKGRNQPGEVFEERFTKHFFVEGQRIYSRIGLGYFENNVLSTDRGILAGAVNPINRLNSLIVSAGSYLQSSVDTLPGEPAIPNYYPQFVYAGRPIPAFNVSGPTGPPNGWPQEPLEPDYQNQPPGEPTAQPTRGITNANVNAGYGYNGSLATEETDHYFYHSDHLGSSNYITNKNGEIRQHQEYTAFGEVFFSEHTGIGVSEYQYNDKEVDQLTGYSYYGARYYDPQISMWLSVDPLANDYPGWSPYNFNSNNPVNRIDLDGNSDQRWQNTTRKSNQRWQNRIQRISERKDRRDFNQLKQTLNSLGKPNNSAAGGLPHFYQEFIVKPLEMKIITENNINRLRDEWDIQSNILGPGEKGDFVFFYDQVGSYAKYTGFSKDHPGGFMLNKNTIMVRATLEGIQPLLLPTESLNIEGLFDNPVEDTFYMIPKN